jgi:uncharacterized membrane protein (Fun14 family)
MEETPSYYTDFLWLLGHVGVPAVIGLVVGIWIRSLIRAVLILIVLGVLTVAALWMFGVAEVDTATVDEAKAALPSLGNLARGAIGALKASPAAVIGLGIGIVIRERWRHRPRRQD